MAYSWRIYNKSAKKYYKAKGKTFDKKTKKTL